MDMTDAALTESKETPKSGKRPLILGLLLAIFGGLGGYYATSTGLLLGTESKDVKPAKVASKDSFSDVAFIPLEPITVSLPQNSAYKHLLFRAELDVNKVYESEVKTVLPRIIDVLNSYLRAVEISDIQESASLTRLRAQMLRRAQIVAGPDRINDLLIMEFVLN
jgi:flagellar FliL protein